MIREKLKKLTWEELNNVKGYVISEDNKLGFNIHYKDNEGIHQTLCKIELWYAPVIGYAVTTYNNNIIAKAISVASSGEITEDIDLANELRIGVIPAINTYEVSMITKDRVLYRLGYEKLDCPSKQDWVRDVWNNHKDKIAWECEREA